MTWWHQSYHLTRGKKANMQVQLSFSVPRPQVCVMEIVRKIRAYLCFRVPAVSHALGSLLGPSHTHMFLISGSAVVHASDSHYRSRTRAHKEAPCPNIIEFLMKN